MSSIGASCAHLYAMKERQDEKLKKMEEVGGDSNDYNNNSGFAWNKKFHPYS
ncbi:hypothetical protein ACJRO7_033374 [Eucalyptus globulus]|uniref:Uncharacterized protein n=1 Tax=Eucalyptus globulus TaxID=34317 RepID=A0ABD3JRB3_EUCGL